MNWSKNLKAHQVFPGAPWEFTDVSKVPPVVRENKVRRDSWINNEKTEHNVYSLFEGINPNCRVYTGKEADDGNPPRKQDGVTCDFDAPANEADVQNGMARIGAHKPAYWGRSLSGHAHVIWLFEKSLNLPENVKFVSRWLKFLRTKIPFHLFLIGFETNSFDDPVRRFTNGGQWTKLSDYVIPDAVVQGWFVEFCAKDKWEEAQFQATVPLDEVAKILAAKYPGFADWPSEFTEGSMGPTFWVPESRSPKSAIVKDGGMYTFSGHAVRSFWPWEDPAMCGPEFVAQYKAKELGKAVDGIYWDEKIYHQKDGKELWTVLNREDTIRHLMQAGVSNRRDAVRRLSPIDMAMNYIQKFQRIAGAAPFIHRREQIIYINDQPYLNISTAKVMSPAPGKWSFDAQSLPFLHPFLTTFFSSGEQLDYFLSWLARSYRQYYNCDPRLGQAVFICGPKGGGKTLLNRGIVAKILGGFQDASKFLSGAENFGSEMYKVTLWSVDDNTTLSTPAKRRYYTEILKSLAANREFKYHEKFRVPALVYWMGRVLVTMNADEESVRGLPDIGVSNDDKVMFFRTADTRMKFPSEDKIRELLAVELPILAAVLLEWKTPEHCIGDDTRYEIKSYHEPLLLGTAQRSSPLSSFQDILDDWKTDYFKTNNEATEWIGTPHQLQKEILRDPASEMAMRDYSLDAINRTISGLKNRGYPVEIFDKEDTRLLRIKRPKDLPLRPTPVTPDVPPQNPDSQFNK